MAQEGADTKPRSAGSSWNTKPNAARLTAAHGLKRDRLRTPGARYPSSALWPVSPQAAEVSQHERHRKRRKE